MALKDRRKEILDFIQNKSTYLNHNHEILEIYEGNLLPKVQTIMEKSLSANYYEKIKERIIPINILQRYINKVSTIYSEPPERFAVQERYQDVVDFYSRQMRLNKHGNIADEYSHLFKGFAWEPFVYKGRPMMRTIPFDRFLVMGNKKENPLSEEVFIKIIGKNLETGNLDYHVYSETEFDAFDSEGGELTGALLENGGINPIGVIPFVYGNRSTNSILPTQDTDILQMSKMLPVLLSDLSGAIMFQCFSIVYGVDVNAENITMSPNAFWDLKSDKETDTTPQVGTIKPEVSIDSVKSFIMETFVLWLESKGVRVGSTSQTNSTMNPSGISKIIDEMDVFDIKKKSIEWFEEDEFEFWKKMASINNYWIKSGQITGVPMLPEDDFEVVTIFDEPMPLKSKDQVLSEIEKELNLNLILPKEAIRKNNPKLSDEEIQEILDFYSAQTLIVSEGEEEEEADAPTENDN